MSRWLSFLALLLCFAASADTITGRVVGVSDGDTITVLDSAHVQHKIRLAGIDAPEKAQPYGQKSKESLSDLVYRKAVVVEFDKVDRYGRQVGKVLQDGLDVNLEQVRRGLAWHYKAYTREQRPEDRVAYNEAESRAREMKSGLWRDAMPKPPWEFRKDRKNTE
jgi:endonuclease YncB( thermonuclease family)